MAGQAQAAAPTISVAASTKLPVVTPDAFVLYQEGAYADAKIHGTISGASAGEVARLYAQPFPYKKAATTVATDTLKASKPRTRLPSRRLWRPTRPEFRSAQSITS